MLKQLCLGLVGLLLLFTHVHAVDIASDIGPYYKTKNDFHIFAFSRKADLSKTVEEHFGYSIQLAQTSKQKSSSPIDTFDMGIVTGSDAGTYYKIGNDIHKLVFPYSINLTVFQSEGSLANVEHVYETKGVHLGIVQSDVLTYIMQVAGTPKQKQIVNKIKMVFPLYNEEIHILSKREIREFSELEGKKIAIDVEKSGTNLTARLMFYLSGVKPSEVKPIGKKEAIEALRAGEVDAMFYIAGYPVTLFQKEVSADDKFHLISIRDKNITEFYPTSKIPSDTYSWQDEIVETVAVKATLMSFEYKGADCKNVGRIARIIRDNLDQLKEKGHPKWRDVDLNFSLKGWEQYSCVRDALQDPVLKRSNTDFFPLPPISK